MAKSPAKGTATLALSEGKVGVQICTLLITWKTSLNGFGCVATATLNRSERRKIMQRYNYGDSIYGARMFKNDDGDYIRYEDVQEERNRLTQRIFELEHDQSDAYLVSYMQGFEDGKRAQERLINEQCLVHSG